MKISPLDRILLLAPLVQAWRRHIPAHVASRFQEELVVPVSAADAIWLARDLADLMDEVETANADWSALDRIVPGERFIEHHELPDEASGIGLTEAARGSLGHWLRIEKGRIANYQIVAPTTWNFSPRDASGAPGPLEQALEGAPVREGETEPVSVQHIVRSFDPCLVCTVH